jgi:hypothetical protein
MTFVSIGWRPGSVMMLIVGLTPLGVTTFFEFDFTVSNEQAALCCFFAATGLSHPR